jgi:hypothetical protein
MSVRGAALSLALLAAAVPARAAPADSAGAAISIVDDGPLGVGTPGILRSLFLEMPLADARAAGTGRPRLDVRWWFANDWSVPTRLAKGSHVVWVQQDAQTDVVQLSLSLPWSRFGAAPWLARWRTTAELRLEERWGGWSDGMIEKWHGIIGSWNFQRELYPRDAVNVTLTEEGGRTLFDVHHPSAAVSDLVLRTQGRLLAGAPRDDGAVPWALALRADLKLPTGLGALASSGGVDAGLGLAASGAPTRWLTLHGQGALRLISPLPHGFPLQPESVEWSLDFSAVARVSRSVALIAEDRVSSPFFRGGWSLPPGQKEPEATAYYSLFKPYNQISGGLRVREITVFFSEDFTPGRRLPTDPGPRWFYNSNAPDFVFGVAWARGL